MSSTVVTAPPVRRMRRFLVLVLAAILGCAAAVSTSSTAQAASGYTVTGVITGLDLAGSVVPVSGATVQVLNANLGTGSYFGQTGADGRFTVDVTQPATYKVSAACYFPARCHLLGHADQFFERANSFEDAKPVVVSTTTPVGVNIHLPRWASFKGKVTDGAGVPIPGIEVTGHPSGGGVVRSTTTDASGAYVLPEIPPGRVYVSTGGAAGGRAWTTEYWTGTSAGSSPTRPSPPPSVAGDTNTGPAGPGTVANFVLAEVTGFTGQAVDSAGAPIAGVGWTVYTLDASTGQWEAPWPGVRKTDTKGQFFWPTAVGGKYKLCFDDNLYGPDAPARTNRFGSRCWDNAADSATATILTQPTTPLVRTLRVVLPVAGKTLTGSVPQVTGTWRVGHTVTATPGAWSPAGVQFAYQWGWSGFTGAWTPIAGATGTALTLTPDLRAETVSVRMTATLTGYAPATIFSTRKPVEAGVLTAPTPTITGTARQGQTLTANAGTWGPAPVTLTHQWNRAGVAITGATAKTYALTASDAGKTITVTVTGYKVGYAESVKTSAASAPVVGTLVAARPRITGTAQVGSIISADPGVWGPAPVTLTYQWYRSGVAITGATTINRKLLIADQGHSMSVRVTGTKPNYVSTSATSMETRPVA